MNELYKNRILKIIAGAERSGKTFFLEAFGNQLNKNGYTFIVYNPGGKDFKDFERVEILGISESLQYLKKEARRKLKIFKQILFFRYNGNIYRIADFNKVLRGKKVKIYRLMENENLFWMAIYKYVSNAFFVIDDARPILKNFSSNGYLIGLFSRKNHTGENSSLVSYREKGLHMATVFHNLDKVPEELYDYATHLVMYKCTRKPDKKKMGNDELYEMIEFCYNDLRKVPKYNAWSLNLKGEEMTKSFIKGESILKLSKL